MLKFTASSVGLLVTLAFGCGSMAQTQQKPAPRVIELTPDKNGKEIKVRVGDEIVLKLPIQSPFDWGLTREVPALKKIPAPLKVVPAGAGATSDQIAGKATISQLRYQVVARPDPPTIEWVYCMFGRAIVNGEPIKPTEPLKPDELPTKRGTYFRAKLVPQD